MEALGTDEHLLVLVLIPDWDKAAGWLVTFGAFSTWHNKQATRMGW